LTEGVLNLGFESSDISYDDYLQLEEKLQMDLLPARNLVEKMRMVKDEDELDKLRMAARIGDQVFTSICQVIKAGMNEREVANLIVTLLKEGGCSKESFDTIAVAGKNAALPTDSQVITASSRETC
jgi:Xaa-Pro aminopeptidase